MLAGGNHINYICGNDADAKGQVIKLLQEFGWRVENILDLGDITNAHATEATLPYLAKGFTVRKKRVRLILQS